MKTKLTAITYVLIISLVPLIGCSDSDSTPNSIDKTSNYVVDLANPIAEIQPTMYGVFFEDINFAADGGLYAEMIKNRSFEFDSPMMAWNQPKSDRHSMNQSTGFANVINLGEEINNGHFLRVQVKANQGYVLQNEGFRGMGIQKGDQYDITVLASQLAGSNTRMKFVLVDADGANLGETVLEPKGEKWKGYATSIIATQTELKAKLNIYFEGKGTIDIDMISMFPKDTWLGRPKGLRKDLVQLLADLKPGFLRFPGGCIVEGRVLSRRYQWKKTVGPIENRDVLINRWNTEFNHRLTLDYFQSFGLGFFEYFQLAEDLGAEPLPILSCGMACQFNSAELVPMNQIDPYVQDALDLIEFANGPITSFWGKTRADMGHPEPFNMKYIGVGNEQWGYEYIERYKVFEAAIKSKYPEMIIISGSGPFPDGEHYDYAMKELKALNADIIDEHYYRNPEWFLENADRYDNYDRNGPKIFAGEYAAQSVAIASPENKNNWQCALSEAAFMTGLERNAEVVTLTSYAPLFAHADGWQWTPDLIWFNNLESYGTPNYYVQKLFSNNPGTHVINLTEDKQPVIGKKGLYATAVKNTVDGTVIIKIVNVLSGDQNLKLDLKGISELAKTGSVTVLKSGDLESINSFTASGNISPSERTIEITGNQFSLTVDGYSLSVLTIGSNDLIN